MPQTKKHRSERGPPFRFKIETEGGSKYIVKVNAPTYQRAEMDAFEMVPEKGKLLRTHASKKQAKEPVRHTRSFYSFE